MTRDIGAFKLKEYVPRRTIDAYQIKHTDRLSENEDGYWTLTNEYGNMKFFMVRNDVKPEAGDYITFNNEEMWFVGKRQFEFMFKEV